MKNKISIIITGAVVMLAVVGIVFARPFPSRVKADIGQYSESFSAYLTQDQEVGMNMATTTVPATATSSGSAVFNVTDNNQSIAYTVNAQNLSSQTVGAHLHCAAAGENGPVIVPLVTSTSTSNTFAGTVSGSDILPIAMSCQPNIGTFSQLIQAMREGRIYVNVHTTNNPAGEIRGQLMRNNSIVSLGNDLVISATSSVATSTTDTSIATSTATSTTDITATSTATTTIPITPVATSTTATTTTSTTTPVIPIPEETSTTTATSTATSTTGTATTTATTTTPNVTPGNWDYVFVQPDGYYKIQGGTIRFMGSHFVPGEQVTVMSNNSSISSVTADQSGSFTTSALSIPYSVGNRVYTFMGSTSQIPFSVSVNVGSNSPWITLNTYYAGAGTPLVITGHQFGVNETVSVWFSGVSIGTAQTDSNGDFTLTTSVPTSGMGQWSIRAIGASSQMIATQSFSQSF